MSSTALPMRRHFWLVLFVLILAGQLRGKSLLVDASSHSMWVAISLPGEQGTPSQSAIFSRAMGSNQWQQLYQIASPIAELSHQGDEPAILLSNGQWMFVFQNGRSLGNDVPGGGNLAELGSDGTNIYAAAWVAGGIKAMQATSRPATAPATMASDQRLVLMRYQRGRWEPVSEVPSVPGNAPLSLAAADGNLLLAWQDLSNHLQIRQWNSKALESLPDVKAPFKVADFKALYSGDQPEIWLAPSSGAGSICKYEGGWKPFINLLQKDGLAKSRSRDVCVDTDEQIRLIYKDGDHIFEQIYSRLGSPAGAPSEILTQQSDQTDTTSSRWLGIAFMAMLVFVLLSAFRRQQAPGQPMPDEAQALPLQLAPTIRRAAAGIIDIIPYFAVIIALSPDVTTYAKASDAMNNPAFFHAILIAMGVYVLHTTIGEVFFARSIGKFILGLKVTNLQGGRAPVMAVIVRNLFRPLDMTVFYLFILISPLGQRIGDLVASTIVVRAIGSAPDRPGANDE